MAVSGEGSKLTRWNIWVGVGFLGNSSLKFPECDSLQSALKFLPVAIERTLDHTDDPITEIRIDMNFDDKKELFKDDNVFGKKKEAIKA